MAASSALALGGRRAGDGGDRLVVGLVGVAHGGSHFFHLVLPPLFPWLSAAFGVSAGDLGLAMALFFAVSGFGQAAVGVLVDRLGAPLVLAAGLALLGLGASIAALAPVFPVLLVAAIVMALGNCVFHPADYAILGHRVAQARLGRAFAVHTIGGSVGWALAPVTMAALATLLGWRAALAFAAVLAFCLAALVWRYRERLATPLSSGGGGAVVDYLRVIRSKPILLCFAFFAAQAVSLLGLQSFMPLALQTTRGIDPVAANATVTVLMLGSALGTLGGGYLADAGRGLRLTIALGLGTAALFVWGLGLAALPFVLIYPLAFAAGGLQGMTAPSRDLLVRASAPPGATGRVFGFVYSGLDLGATLGPLLLGALIDAGHPDFLFATVAGFILLSCLFAALVPKPRSPNS